MSSLSKSQIQDLFAQALRQMGQMDYFTARAGFARIAAAVPGAPEPLYHMGRIELALGRPHSAVEVLERARALKPAAPEILAELAQARARIGDRKACLALHDKRIRQMKGAMGALMGKALALQQFGDFDAAEMIFRKARPKGRNDGEFYRIWSASHRFRDPADPVLRDALALWDHPRLNDKGRLHLGFALAKAMQDLKRYEEVFKYLDPANRLQAAAAPYDRAARERSLAEMRRLVPGPEVARVGSCDFAPIIVTGMPRSGTTLIERILSAHPDVRAGGEIGQARLMCHLTLGAEGAMPPLARTPLDQLDLFAERYAAAARETAPGNAPRVTDKSIQTHLILGHVAAAFPKAHLIVVRRDPRDIALSIYRNHFALGTHRYACDLGDIAHQMHTFDQAIAYWRDRVPLTEVSYDALIADPDGQSRALVAAAGLSWDDACLRPEEAEGSVTTLSLAQVRQPIYKSSAGGWRRFEEELTPFIDAWEQMT